MRCHFPPSSAAMRCCLFSSILLVNVTVCSGGLQAKTELNIQTETLQANLGGDPNRVLRDYFEQETKRIEQKFSLLKMDGKTWLANKEKYRKQYAEMLGLSPMPKRTALKVTITGEIKEENFIVRKLHYQSSPGLYVTANLYLPRKIEKPVPAILYVCGHARRVKDGVSFGNKTGYHHHGIWFAQNGYACLMIDTIQLGELQGIHHGTYKHKMWWWNARGYTPAGVEAWNGIRGIDYLQSLKEVDGDKIGVTGRSGGGAYTWSIAALDKRVKAAVPVAGITSMRNHIVDDCIEGHCDCMFMVNSYGWDFPVVAALVAPRPLLITNTDKDRIFPLDGVMDVYWQTRHIYKELDAADKIGIAIAEGPHKDTQRLQVNAFEWFDRFLKDKKSDDLKPSVKMFEPEQLKVFKELPPEERTTKIHDTFVPTAIPPIPLSIKQWKDLQKKWKADLTKQCFGRWANENVASNLNLKKVTSSTTGNLETTTYTFSSQSPFTLPIYLVEPVDLLSGQTQSVTIYILEADEWELFQSGKLQKKIVTKVGSTCFIPTRGIGPTAWKNDVRNQTQIRRRFALLGQSLDSSRMWDARRAIHAVREIPQCKGRQIHLRAKGIAADIAMYASIFEEGIATLTLENLPATHANGATFLNVLKILDTPQAIALAEEKTEVKLINPPEDIKEYANRIRHNINQSPQPGK